MKPIISYALRAALEHVRPLILKLEGRRDVKTPNGLRWQADSIGLQAEIGELLTEELTTDVRFLCTGEMSTIFYGKQQLEVRTPWQYKQRAKELLEQTGAKKS